MTSLRTRRISLLVVLYVLCCIPAKAQTPNTINTIVGGGTQPTSPTAAFLGYPFSVVRDSQNNVYISSFTLNAIYKINGQGQLSVYAGTGTAGFSGDGGAATAAQLDAPEGLALDSGGNLYIADEYNNRIRRVDSTTGVITTYAGSGNQYNGVGFFGGYSGDSGPATSALLNQPTGLAFDHNNNLFIVDGANEVVRMVDNTASHIITTYAGNGTTGTPGTANGDGGPATSAELNFYYAIGGVAVDSAGNLYIADAGDSVIRVVDTSASHIITTYAGSPSHPFTFSGDGGPAGSAGLNTPMGVALDSTGDLFIADTFNGHVRKVDTTASHIITTAVGDDASCLSYTSGCGDGGAPTSASLNRPIGVSFDGAGNLFIVDNGTSTVRAVSPAPTSIVSTFAGGGSGGLGGPGTGAILAGPYTIVSDGSGNLYVLDGNSVNRFDATSKTFGEYAGNGVEGVNEGPGNGDNGPAATATFFAPFAEALDASGNLFVGDFRLWVRRVDAVTKTITTIAGTGATCNPAVTPTCGDGGSAASATFRNITGLATDSQGNVYISDAGLNRIRRINISTGVITNYAGTGTSGYTGDGGPATSAALNYPYGLAFDSQNNLYVADLVNNVIRKIDNTTEHNITTYAFNGLPTFGGDNGSALSASMENPYEVAVDTRGNLFVGGGYDNVVRRIDAIDQSVTTVAGDVANLDGGFSGDGGPSTQALMSNFGVAVDGKENLYIADEGNNRVRSVNLLPGAVVDSSSLPSSFGTLLPGETPLNFGYVEITNSGLDDLVISNIDLPSGFVFNFQDCSASNTGTSSFTLTPGANKQCLIEIQFAPGSGAAPGPVSGNFTFSTNDPANPSFSFPVSGTVASSSETLTVTLAGTGSGTVETVQTVGELGSSGGTIQCPTTCSATLALNQQVTLAAESTAASSVFSGWTVNGSATTCPGTGVCTVTMSQALNVVATFNTNTAPPPALTVAGVGNGSGTITSSPAGINCTVTNGTLSGACTFSSFAVGTTYVTLTATPTGNSSFAGWWQGCSGQGLNGAFGPCQYYLPEASVFTAPQVVAVFSGPPQAFAPGQVFVGSSKGMIFVYNPNGALAQVLSSGSLSGEIYGMNFDQAGNLYAANGNASILENGTVEFFGNDGVGPTTFGSYPSSTPSDVLVDASNNVFVGESNGVNLTLLEFAGEQNGSPTATFYPAYDGSGGNLFFDVLSDNASVLYTTSGTTVGNFDILNNHQNPDVVDGLPANSAYQVRGLSDGSVLLADVAHVVRLSATGTILQIYTPGGTGIFYALALNPDGLSFWTINVANGNVYQVRISDGTILNTISTGVSGTTGGFVIGGIAVLGQPQPGAADVSVSMTASPSPASPDSPITYTITVKNNGPASAANVVLTDVFSFDVEVESSSTSLGSCSGTNVDTCVLGTMPSGQSATVTIVVLPTLAGTLLNNVTVTSTTPDLNGANNTATSSTPVVSGPVLTILGAGNGSGTITDNLGDIVCVDTAGVLTGSCSASYSSGTVVTLTAIANSGSTFASWGTCAGTGTCGVTMNANQSESVTFTASPQTFTFSVMESGSGSGKVTDGTGQIDCVITSGVVTGSCSGSYSSGTVVMLAGSASSGSLFSGWSGPCSGTTPCSVTVTMNGQSVGAAFAPAPPPPMFTLTLTELGTGTGSVADNSGAPGTISCSEANGLVTGTCSASYASGTVVVLNENATAPTTFGGWGGACSSSGTTMTCSLTMTASMNATANFLPPPASVTLPFTPGTNVTQQAVFDCPNNPNPTPANPCTDANAHSMQLSFPQVNQGFTLTTLAVEVPPSQFDGLCEVGNTVLNDFDCRFATFFNYGTDANGNTIVPLCYPYANGNCVHYEVFLQGTQPGTEPDPSSYTGPVNWQIGYNNSTFVPPGPYWTGSQPQFYDDPDGQQAAGTAVGSVCTQPMTINGVAQNYACQFEFDVTTFVNLGEPVDPVIGAKTKQLTDVVIAFPPNTAGQLTVTSTPDAATVNAGQPIGFTIAVSNAGPGVESNVTLNDPLPAGVTWTLSPYSGPGSCGVAGAAGSQTLTCSFGSLEAGGNASLHVAGGAAGAGTYINTATVTVSNPTLMTTQEFLTIATITVQPVSSGFSSLTVSQTITAGTGSINLSGVIAGPGPVYPATSETISVTINGATHTAPVGPSGAFLLAFPTATIPASATPYTITYSYAGDANLTAVSDSSTSLTVNALVSNYTLSLTEMGTGTGMVTDNKGQISCSEASGLVTGSCSGSYPSGTLVILTATFSAPTTFGGWGGACSSSGTTLTCSLTMTASMNATANFLPPPASVTLPFTPGTNVTQQAVFDCPNNPNPTPANPCTDANAHSMQLSFPQVNQGFTLTTLAVEVPPSQFDGLCEVGNTVLNDFDCRFATFFNYGTDANGNTIVPLCYPYANGNCVHYEVFLQGTQPGTEPDPSSYTGPVNWQIGYNNSTFVPPGPYWTGSQPQFYDDPDGQQAAGTAVGSVCTQPMTINGVAQNYACQFEFDVTTFVNLGEPVDPVIGAKTKQLTDVVIAFPPNTAGQLTVTSTPDAATVNAGQPIGFTIAVSNAGPGVESNVTLNDPLPAGVTWTLSPYSGPGSCGVAGAAGSQTLTCSFGSLEAGGNASLHVAGGAAGAGTYINTATVTVSNPTLMTTQEFLTIATVTAQPVASVTTLTLATTGSGATESVTLSAQVSSGSGTPAGMVAFYDGTTHLGTAPLNSSGAASFTVSPVTGGSHSFTAAYEGSAYFAPSTSSPAPLVVGVAPPTIGSRVGTMSLNATTSGQQQYVVTVSLSNAGNLASTVQVTSAAINGISSSSIPISAISLPAYGSSVVTLDFPSNAGVPGAHVVLTVSGTYSALQSGGSTLKGSWTGSFRVTLPASSP